MYKQVLLKWWGIKFISFEHNFIRYQIIGSPLSYMEYFNRKEIWNPPTSSLNTDNLHIAQC